MDDIESPGGKFPKALGNVVVMEAKWVHNVINQAIENFQNANPISPDLLRPLLPFLNPDQRIILEQIIDALENFDETVNNFRDNFDIDVRRSLLISHLQHYSLSIVTMYTDRFETYVKSQAGMDADLITFTNEVADTLGYTYPATFSLPLRMSLQPLQFIRMFLDQVSFVSF